jgi:hypothetical protein
MYQAKIKEITKELTDKLIKKEIDSKTLFDCLEIIEIYKIENGIINTNWKLKIRM